jgi:hypothetical protein
MSCQGNILKMPVPASVPLKSDSSFKAPATFKRKKPFDNTFNIVNILKNGGILRGVFFDGEAYDFEILTKKERSEGLEDAGRGAGRWVPTSTILWMVKNKEISVPPTTPEGHFIYAQLTQDEFFTAGFPTGWGVRHVPSTDATYLFGPSEPAYTPVCVKPSRAIVEEWVLLAKLMAHGLANSVMTTQLEETIR